MKKSGSLSRYVSWKVAVGRDSLEPDLLHQPLHVRLAQREHVQVEYRAVREAVTEPRERLVDVLGCRRHVLAAIVVTMRRLDLLVENRVVVALIKVRMPSWRSVA